MKRAADVVAGGSGVGVTTLLLLAPSTILGQELLHLDRDHLP
ncbi:MAG: hypothetical protein WD960_04125 [Gemmatimonadota bacterium]